MSWKILCREEEANRSDPSRADQAIDLGTHAGMWKVRQMLVQEKEASGDLQR